MSRDVINELFNLKGKAALVKGAAQGIGKAIALLLASGASDYITGESILIDGGFVNL